MAKSRRNNSEIVTQNVFTALNYKLMGIGIAAIFIGFVLMAWENKYDGFVSLFIAPPILMFGFAEIIYAIMKVDSSEEVQN